MAMPAALLVAAADFLCPVISTKALRFPQVQRWPFENKPTLLQFLVLLSISMLFGLNPS